MGNLLNPITFTEKECRCSDPTLEKGHPIIEVIEGIGIVPLPKGWDHKKLESYISSLTSKLSQLLSGEIEVVLNKRQTKIIEVITR
jgi:hypothetical protein